MRASAGECIDHRGIKVIALPALGYSRNVSARRYLDHRRVASAFRAIAPRQSPPDLILASVPCHHLAAAGVEYARERRIPCAVDLRDLWPDVFGQIFPKWLSKIVLASEFRVLRRALRNADALLGISPGYVSLAVERAGRASSPHDRYFYLGAPPIPEAMPALPPCLPGAQDKKLFVYAGSYGLSYELLLVANAARELAKRRTDFMVVFAGAGDQEATLKEAMAHHPSALAVGWLPGPQLAALVSQAYVGLAPFRRGSPQSVPNKAFDYFAAGVPVISSLEGEMQSLLEEQQLGMSYRAGDYADLTRVLDQVLSRPALRDAWAKNAAAFFAREGNAERIYEAYSSHLENLVERYSGNDGSPELAVGTGTGVDRP